MKNCTRIKYGVHDPCIENCIYYSDVTLNPIEIVGKIIWFIHIASLNSIINDLGSNHLFQALPTDCLRQQSVYVCFLFFQCLRQSMQSLHLFLVKIPQFFFSIHTMNLISVPYQVEIVLQSFEILISFYWLNFQRQSIFFFFFEIADSSKTVCDVDSYCARIFFFRPSFYLF